MKTVNVSKLLYECKLRGIYPTNKEIIRYAKGEISFDEIRDFCQEIAEDCKSQEDYTRVLQDRCLPGGIIIE